MTIISSYSLDLKRVGYQTVGNSNRKALDEHLEDASLTPHLQFQINLFQKREIDENQR